MVNFEGSNINSLFVSFHDNPQFDESWVNSRFLKPAYDMVIFLQNFYNDFYNCNLVFLEIDKIDKFKRVVKKSMYLHFDLNTKSGQSGKHTFRLLDNAGKVKVASFYHSRRTECMYYSLCFTQNFLNVFCYRTGRADSSRCRFCDSDEESIDHIFLYCTSVDNTSLQHGCDKLNCDFTCSVLLTNTKLKILVEKFLEKHFK